MFCGDELARCPFAKGGAVAEGLPVLTVDEEIYRLTPVFVIATVDKFARLAREGEAAALFGYVGRRCGRHGYVHPDYAGCTITTTHPATDNHPAATVRPVDRLRPPDLIIQDELHLITGALGTAVGLFEVAVDTLASWEFRGRQGGAAADRGLHGDGPQRRTADPRTLRAASGDVPAAGARRRRHLLLPRTADHPGHAGPALPRYQRAGRAAFQRGDPGVRGAAVGRAAAVRPLRGGRRPVHDAGGLFQRDPGTGGHVPLHG